MNLEEKGLAERDSSMTGGKLRTCLTQDPSAPKQATPGLANRSQQIPVAFLFHYL